MFLYLIYSIYINRDYNLYIVMNLYYVQKKKNLYLVFIILINTLNQLYTRVSHGFLH